MIWIKTCCLALIFLTLPFANAGAKQTSRPANATVALSGEFKSPLAAGIDDLKKLALHTVRDLPIVCRSGEVKDTLKTARGALLRDLLDKAHPNLPGHFDANHAYVVIAATDGYKVIFSWNELYNTPVGDDVVLVYERDGQPLSAKEGPFLLISGKDRTTGPRHVRNVQSVELRLMK